MTSPLKVLMQGVHPQPSHKCVEESADICNGLRGAWGLLHGFAIPPIWFPLPSPQLWLHSCPWWPADFPWLTQWGCHSLPLSRFSFGSLYYLLPLIVIQILDIPWLVLPWLQMPGPLTALWPDWAYWGEAGYPLPYSEYGSKHQIGDCSLAGM